MKKEVIRGYFKGKEFVMYALELTTKKEQEEFEKINNAYGEEVEKRFEKRRKEELKALAEWERKGPWYF